jgi:tetratricopeptide (TPR) repeat protein
MKPNALLLFLLGFLPITLFAQSNPLDKKLAQMEALYNEGKHENADKQLSKLLEDNPTYGKGWDMLAMMRYTDYERDSKLSATLGNLTVTTESKDGTPVDAKTDSMAQHLAQMLNSFSPGKQAWSKFTYTMRKGLLYSQDAYQSSMLWRRYNVDVNVDSNVSHKALKYFKQAEDEYEGKNYHSAAMLYRRALSEQPNFYKAKLYMADALYASENYADAMKSFQESADQFPDQIEPHKYLTDAYAKLKLYDKALHEAIQTMAVYPDINMLSKLDDAAYLNNKKLDIKWTPRAVFPNRIRTGEAGIDMNRYSQKDDEDTPPQPWTHYVAASEKARPYVNSEGIITDKALLDGAAYLEVYSWMEMLRESKDPVLDEARKMQAAGFLDCYVLVTCYHPDIYEQYRHFSQKNKDKITKYYQSFLKDM